MKTHLYNTAHPLAESGKPIFIPFGEWKYDGQSRQRLDRAHGEKIANELNARVAKGDPGIPVYQGHPDVPALAAKYPDKGALGWVVRAELANEDGKDGLALTVEWDRDPGRGFRWFSPYWLANSREGGTYIVDEIASIGLVNNPNIPEFRLANEEQPMKKKLNPAIIELAAKYDRAREAAHTEAQRHGELANSTDANGREHVEAGSPEGGQFAPKTEGVKLRPSEQYQSEPEWHDSSTLGKIFYPSERQVELGMKADATSNRASAVHNINKLLERSRTDYHNATIEKKRVRHDAFLKEAVTAEQRVALRDRASLHRVAILQGFSYNAKTHQYDLANEANFDESKHPRSEDGKFSSGGGGGGGKSAGETQSGGGTSYREKQIAARQADLDSAQKAFDEAKAALIAGQKRGWSKEEDDKAFKVYDRAERKLAFAKRELRSAIGAPPISRAEQMRRDTKDVFHGNASQATRARLIAELAARFNFARKAK